MINNAMSFTKYPIKSLLPYINNARTHSDEQIDQIAASIQEFGFNNPILIDERQTIIAGHGRLLAAKKLGLDEVPVISISHLTPAQKKAYILADNRIALNAGWSPELLKLEFESLKEIDFDLGLTGFTDDEIDAYLNPEIINECEDEEGMPELQPDPISKLRDVWILGNHRLMCGDSTVIDNVEKLIDGLKPNLMVTDPPYGVNYDAEWREKSNEFAGKRSVGKVENDDKYDWMDAYSLFSGDVMYIWHAAIYTNDIAKNIIDCDFKIISQIIWAKQHFAISRGDYHWQHEPCWYAVRNGKKHNWQGKRDQSTLWEIKNNNSIGNQDREETVGHSTQKPIECMARPILNNSKPGEYVYDPFGGSGTTLIAADKYGRKCLMMEISPQYCDVIIKRWEKFTENDAILESNKQKFKDLAHG